MANNTEKTGYFQDKSEVILTWRILVRRMPDHPTTSRLHGLIKQLIECDYEPKDVIVDSDERTLINDTVLNHAIGPKEDTVEYAFALHRLGEWATDRAVSDAAGVEWVPVNELSKELLLGVAKQPAIETP